MIIDFGDVQNATELRGSTAPMDLSALANRLEALEGGHGKAHGKNGRKKGGAKGFSDNYYGGKARFPKVYEDMMAAVDKGDSARFTQEEILDPRGWVLLNFLMDARTGLGRFRNFRVSNYQLMMQLINTIRG